MIDDVDDDNNDVDDDNDDVNSNGNNGNDNVNRKGKDGNNVNNSGDVNFGSFNVQRSWKRKILLDLPEEKTLILLKMLQER